MEQGLWSLLEPSRLLDLIAHFIVFEREDGRIIKKICRYQQFRAVNKIVNRVADNDKRRGLIWHTQGSGKSLTMVFAALKLKKHQTIDSPALANPNIMVLTDRVDLDEQISGTFVACGLPNPESIKSVKDLRGLLNTQSEGLMVLSTIFKFQGSTQAIENSKNWIVLVDECHRTQEKDLGAYLRATLPDAQFFGFTGTPIKKTDKNTYENFGVVGEGYLDKYGIDDAVADGATVPIHYTGRKTDWHIDDAQIDILFDQWFADLPDEQLEKLKRMLVHSMKHSDSEILQARVPQGINFDVINNDAVAAILVRGRNSDGELQFRKSLLDAGYAAGAAGGAFPALRDMAITSMLAKRLGCDLDLAQELIYWQEAKNRKALGYPTNVTPHAAFQDLQGSNDITLLTRVQY